MSRTRSKSITARYTRTRKGVVDVDSIFSPMKEVFYDHVPGPGSCLHAKCAPAIGFSQMVDNGVTVTELRQNYTNLPDFSMIKNSAAPPSLDWANLESSSSFNLIAFFAELDDVLFRCLKFKGASYAEWQWGVLPFISDIIGMVEAIAALDGTLSDFPYEGESSSVVDLKVPYNSGTGTITYHYTGNIHYRMTGSANISHIPEAAMWLDRLGFHPDVSTAWDLVPFSFVVDWLLPCSQWLDGLVHRGWVDSMFFTGWLTAKANLRCDMLLKGFGNPGYPPNTIGCTFPDIEIFSRDYVGPLLVTQPRPEELVFEAPSMRNLVQMFYLFLLTQGKLG